jgi:hypothetical protein
MFSNVVLLSRSWGESGWKAVLGATFTLGVTVASILATLAIRQLHRQDVRDRNSAVAASTSRRTEERN